MTRPSRLLPLLGGLAIVFGLLTLGSGGKALFGTPSEGPVVPFVLWFNFLAGFVYVAGGVGLLLRKRWAAQVSVALAASTAAVFVAFAVYAAQGGAFAPRTVGALTVRTLFWAFAAYRAHLAFAAAAEAEE